MSAAEHDFPVDDATLVMLAEACRINPEMGRTTLHDFLDMGTRVESVTDEATGDRYSTMDEAIEDTSEYLPVFFVEYDPDRAPYSETGVILALIAEIERLRAAGGRSG